LGEIDKVLSIVSTPLYFIKRKQQEINYTKNFSKAILLWAVNNALHLDLNGTNLALLGALSIAKIVF
jgi:hypothetical protein